MPLSATSEVWIPWVRPFTPNCIESFQPWLQPARIPRGDTTPYELIAWVQNEIAHAMSMRRAASFSHERTAPPHEALVGLTQAYPTNPQ